MTDKPDLEATLVHYGVHVTGLHGNRQVLCPAHDESVPSCSVNLDKQLLHCFSCGFRGDSITLIMQKENCDYPGALRFAEEKLSYTPQPTGRPRVGLDGRGSGGYRPRAVRARKGLGG